MSMYVEVAGWSMVIKQCRTYSTAIPHNATPCQIPALISCWDLRTKNTL